MKHRMCILVKLPALAGTCALTAMLTWSAVVRGQDEAANAFEPAIEHAQQRVVKIYGGSIGRSPGYASGIVVSEDGQILTSQGAFLATGNLRVTFPDGSMHPAKVLRRSPTLQAALLQVESKTPHYFDIPEQPRVSRGDWILAVSNAFKVADGREPLSVNIGVLGLRTRLDARRGFQDFPYEGDVYLYDAITSNPGADGGAVVDSEGKLVGMIGKVIESKSTNTRLNYAVPADLLLQFIKGESSSLSPQNTAARPGPPELGIRLFALGGRNSPAYIDRVVANSPAAAAGLRADDMVISVAGQIVRNGADFQRIVATLKAGQEVAIEVKRQDQVLTVHIKLGEAQ